MLTNQKILADESRKPYKDISLLSPRFRPVMRRCLARMEAEKALVAKARVFNFDVKGPNRCHRRARPFLDNHRVALNRFAAVVNWWCQLHHQHAAGGTANC